MRSFLPLRVAFCVLVCAVLGHATPVFAIPPLPPKSVPTIDAAKYRATLETAKSQLERMESGKAPRKGLEKLLTTLSQPASLRVQRSDGAKQLIGNDQWARFVLSLQNDSTGRAAPTTRVDVTQARRAVDERLRALNEWMQPRPDGFYQAAQAQKIVRDLAGTNQIRTQPTGLQQWWAGFKAAFSNFIKGLSRSVFGAGKSVAPTRPMNLDDRWVKFFFYSTVLSLLGVVGWLLWRHLGGRLGRDGARRDVRFAGGDDAELLVLPQGELRTRAQRFADDGNFREAVRHRFIALLLLLDERAVWRYDARRTNWEHIGTLRRRMSTHVASERLVEPLSNLTRRFDRVRYGNAPVALDDWNAFDRDSATLEELARLEPTAAPSISAAATGARS